LTRSMSTAEILDEPPPLLESRREFMTRIVATPVAIALASQITPDPSVEAVAPATGATSLLTITLNVNGRSTPLTMDPRVTLLDTVREQMHLTGTKKRCDQGQWVACT